MSFTSFEFPGFALLFFVCYFVLPLRARAWWLLLASGFFYLALIPEYLFILLALIGIDYTLGLGIERAQGVARRWLLIASFASNLGVLFVFKYLGFFGEMMRLLADWTGTSVGFHLPAFALPLGLSFHTFQSLSYIVEVYRGRQPAERSLLRYSLYVMFWPQLVAGPIERPQNLLPQFHATPRPTWEDVRVGARWILLGYVKKLVIADRLAIYVNWVFEKPSQHPGWPMVIATYFFAFQIYCDFSGYTDIARGVARCFGYRLMENFRAPYLAASFQDFWRRWHISLSTWFRDYLFRPLLGPKSRTAARYALAVMVTFLLSGLWHGANITFLIWGLLHGAFLTAESLTVRMRERWHGRSRQVLAWLFTFHAVTFAWIFFRAQSVADATFIVGHLRDAIRQSPQVASESLRSRGLGCALGALLLIFGGEYLWRSRPNWSFAWWPWWLRWTAYYAAIGAILRWGVFTQTSFVYFQF